MTDKYEEGRGAEDHQPCDFRATSHHSDDRVNVYHGTIKPLVLCGYHASPDWLPRVLDWYNGRQGVRP